MRYLKDNGYQVISLKALPAYLSGKKEVPEKTVAITIDDGHHSALKYAAPILTEFEFPTTFFIYTDHVDNGSIQWQQLKNLAANVLFDIQAHSKSHENLVIRYPNESDKHYQQRINTEITHPKATLKKRLEHPINGFAYPYGDANSEVISELKKAGYQFGYTVTKGGNNRFSDPFLLNRTLIYGDRSFKDFIKTLQTEVSLTKDFLTTPKNNKELSFYQKGQLAYEYKHYATAKLWWQKCKSQCKKALRDLNASIDTLLEERLTTAKNHLKHQQFTQAEAALLNILAWSPNHTEAVTLMRAIDRKKELKTLATKTTNSRYIAHFHPEPTTIQAKKSTLPLDNRLNETLILFKKTLAKQQLISAEKYLSEAIHLESRSKNNIKKQTLTTYKNQLANTYHQKGLKTSKNDLEKSIVYFQKALSYNPNHTEAGFEYQKTLKKLETGLFKFVK